MRARPSCLLALVLAMLVALPVLPPRCAECPPGCPMHAHRLGCHAASLRTDAEGGRCLRTASCGHVAPGLTPTPATPPDAMPSLSPAVTSWPVVADDALPSCALEPAPPTGPPKPLPV